jgi:hypothetical protein
MGLSLMPLARNRRETERLDPISIADQVAWDLIPGEGFGEGSKGTGLRRKGLLEEANSGVFAIKNADECPASLIELLVEAIGRKQLTIPSLARPAPFDCQ